MKILLFSGLLFISTLVTEKSDCDSIQLDLGITHTSEGKNNGKIEVTVEKGRAPFTVYLFAAKREDNLEDVKFKDLKDLKRGDYILVVQDKDNKCTFNQKITIR